MMSRSTEIPTRSLDLVARSVDLVSTLIEASNSSGGLLHLGIQIGEWLQHEKVNRHELKDCFEKAHGLAWPNRNGEVFQAEVRTKPATKPLVPFVLQQSGSLGRWLVYDEALCWIVSTTGCLLRYHKESFVTIAIVTIIMESQAKNQSSKLPAYDFGRMQILSVVKKIVSSVWFNIVNAGNETMGLPDTLTNVCTVGHNLPPEHLGRVVAALQQDRSYIVIRSARMYQNLALWLLLHFHGRFVVTVSGKIVLQEDLGRTSTQARELELRIQSFCHSNAENLRGCVSVDRDHIEILENVAGKFESFFDNKVPEIPDLQSDTQIRQDLYNPKPPRASGRPRLPEDCKIWARCTAQEMTRWLLNLSVSGVEDIESFGLSINLDPKASAKKTEVTLKVADVLKRMPGILNKEWGDCPPSNLVFAARVEEENEDDSDSYEAEWETSHTASLSAQNQTEQPTTGLETLLQHFPILRKLTHKMRAQCRCTFCHSGSSGNKMEKPFKKGQRGDTGKKMGSPPLKEGCLQHLALLEVLVLLSHAIADALGVDSTSARRDNSLIEGMIELLRLLVEKSIMSWDVWFCVAGSVLLGCPVKNHPSINIEQGTSVCALQYGSLAAVAGWLDMNNEPKVHGSFSLIYGEGKLGTMNEDKNGNQFRGLASDYAIIQTDETEDTTSYTEKHPKKAEHNFSEMWNFRDSSKAKSDYILVSLGQEVYRLLTRVQSDTHSRIIDPVQVMSQTARRTLSLPTLSDSKRREHAHCGHNLSLPGTVSSYSFDEVLGRWPEAGPPDFLVSHILDTNLKLNVAYALSGNERAVSNSETPCLECIALYRGEEGARSNEPMYIINATSNTLKLEYAIETMAPEAHSAKMGHNEG